VPAASSEAAATTQLPGTRSPWSRSGESLGLAEAPIVALVIAITAAGLLVRLPAFGDSLFGDEVGAYWVITGHGLGTVMHLLRGHSPELNPPLWFVLAWISEKLFGVSPQSLKLVSLLAGTATIPLTYLLGRWTVSVRAGLVASALAALSPFLIYYSTEARPYALLVLLCLLSSLALLQALRSGRAWWWAAYALCSCAAAYTHYTAVFLLGAQFVWALVTQPQARRALVAANLAAVVAYLPWLPQLIRTSHSPGTKLYQTLEPFGLHAMRVDLERWSLGHPYLPISSLPGRPAVVLVLAGVVVALVGAAVAWRRRLRTVRLSARGALVIVLAGAAPVGIAVYSALHESVWSARNIISSWPGLAVALGALLTLAGRPWRWAAVALALVGFGVGAVDMTESFAQRPDYQSAAAYIDRRDPGSAPVVDLVAPTPGPPTETEAALAIQRTRPRPVLRIGIPPLRAVLAAPPYASLPVPGGEVIARQAAALAGHGLLFIVAPTAVSIGHLEATRRRHLRDDGTELGDFATFLGALPARFHPLGSRTFPGLAPVTVYVYRG